METEFRKNESIEAPSAQPTHLLRGSLYSVPLSSLKNSSSILRAYLNHHFPDKRPGRGRHLAVETLFGNRATYRAIRHWCEGRRRMPNWAFTVVQELIQREQAEIDHLHALLKAHMAAEQKKRPAG